MHNQYDMLSILIPTPSDMNIPNQLNLAKPSFSWQKSLSLEKAKNLKENSKMPKRKKEKEQKKIQARRGGDHGIPTSEIASAVLLSLRNVKYLVLHASSDKQEQSNNENRPKGICPTPKNQKKVSPSLRNSFTM